MDTQLELHMNKLEFIGRFQQRNMDVIDIHYEGEFIGQERVYYNGWLQQPKYTVELPHMVTSEDRAKLDTLGLEIDYQEPPYGEDGTDYRMAVFTNSKSHIEDFMKAYLFLVSEGIINNKKIKEIVAHAN